MSEEKITLEKEIENLKKQKAGLVSDLTKLNSKIKEAQGRERAARVLERRSSKGKTIGDVNRRRLNEKTNALASAIKKQESYDFMLAALESPEFTAKFLSMARCKEKGIPFYSLKWEIEDLKKLI